MRVVSSTSRVLSEDIALGRFREDLYYRLNVVPVQLQALSERREDVPSLVRHFASRYAADQRVATPEISDDAMAALQAYDWPGNVRELDNVVSRAVLRASFGRSPDETIMVGVEHLALTGARPQSPALPPTSAVGTPVPLRQQLDEFQRRVIRESLERHGGKWAAVARELGLHRSNLHTLAKRLGLTTG